MTRLLPLPDRYDLRRSLFPLALGHDLTVRITGTEVWWATRGPLGPATLHLAVVAGSLRATAYGPGAEWALDQADAVAGLRDDLAGFGDLAGGHPLVARLAREHSGLRLPRTGRLFHHLVPTILSQKVTGLEAKRSYAALVRHFGEPAPGPVPAGLLLPPDPAILAATPYWVLHPFGVEQRRAETIRRAAAHATALEAAPDTETARRRLTSVAGIGAWTAAEVVRVSHGDADAVSVGDYHIPNQVAWALAGEPRGDDARMLELLEPFRGHRGRVCQLLSAAGISAPRFGPRMPVRSFARF